MILFFKRLFSFIDFSFFSFFLSFFALFPPLQQNGRGFTKLVMIQTVFYWLKICIRRIFATLSEIQGIGKHIFVIQAEIPLVYIGDRTR